MDNRSVRYSDAFIEDLKSRLRLSDVIGKSVKLKRAGREYVGLSPFNKEKSPSFYVNDEKGFFHDFSSGKHGDLIAFYQETERLSFVEAIERMAAEAGVALPDPDPQAARQEEKRQGLQDWLGLAAKWFEGELRRPGGQAAAAYLEKRGLPADQWARFGVGFAPAGRTALKDYLVAKGAKPAELVEAGLLIAPEEGGAPYDRFRDRIIFPITDTRGRVVSFGGRAMDPNARAKYLNGPDSPLFDKGRTLYGLFEARKVLHAAGEGAPLVVVEGYMDVIACHRAGVAAVAPMGTALTEGQMELLWRLHGEPTLCFDGDAAGRRAAGRAIDRALPLLKPGRSFKFAMVTGGKDPDDVLREQGPAALKAQLSETRPFVVQLFEREKEAEPLDTPERKAGLKVRLRKLAAAIADADLAQAYRDDLLKRFDDEVSPSPASRAGATLANARWDRQRSGGGWKRGGKEPPGRASEEGRASAEALKTSPKPMSAALALAALADPGVLDDNIERLAARGFHDSQLDAIANELVALRFEADHLEADFVRRRLQARGFDDAAMVRLSRAAQKAGISAPFLDPQTPRDRARALWTRAFTLLMDLEALERAVSGAKEDMARGEDSAAFMRLKTERDLLKRLIDSGDWQAEESALTH
jgi:DNA primase